MAKIKVLDTNITIVKQNKEDYISLTDMAKSKNPNNANEIIRNWLRNRNTIEFLGIWKKIHNPNSNYGEFAIITSQAGLIKWSNLTTLKQSNSTGLKY